jgi:hypothetical protein
MIYSAGNAKNENEIQSLKPTTENPNTVSACDYRRYYYIPVHYSFTVGSFHLPLALQRLHPHTHTHIHTYMSASHAWEITG